MPFKLFEPYKPAGDQPKAIEKLVKSLKVGHHAQTLLGVTGSGKTYTVAHAIASVQKPTLVIAHNKTLAAQLTQEFRTFFPENSVEYFVSYYDYYQPEAYLPGQDIYIEKEAEINDEIDRLRHAATSSLLRDPSSTIVVASVSCIYGLGSPEDYVASILDLAIGDDYDRNSLIRRLMDLYYERSTILERGRFKVLGSNIELVPVNQEQIIRIELLNDKISRLFVDDFISRKHLSEPNQITIPPAKHFVASKMQVEKALISIETELNSQLNELRKTNKQIEADRLERRTKYDLRLIREIGYCSGIENYSRHFSQRLAGEPPETLLDYFSESYLVVIDESHVTIPQIRGMHAGDAARKDALVEHGFRLPSARDNRPLTFNEFENRVKQLLFVSATPSNYELKSSINSFNDREISDEDIRSLIINDNAPTIVQQVIRPTGLVDPEVIVRPITSQVADVIKEIEQEISLGQRVLVTALTKKMAEDLSEYLTQKQVRSKYLHSDVETLERIKLLEELRRGKFDVLVGVNLLREGLDLPEVSLVIILDADNEGFLRSETSLIQTIGRAARNVRGRVILYADKMTGSIKRALEETDRRRNKQLAYNKEHNITPKTIEKAIASIYVEEETPVVSEFKQIINPDELPKLIMEREKEMKRLAKDLQFEQAAILRDEIIQLRKISRSLKVDN